MANVDVQALRELLAKLYGITTDQQLNDAIKNMEPLNIAMFVAPLNAKSQGSDATD